LFLQCSATCDGVRRRKLDCKLGNVSLAHKKCLEKKPNMLESCSPPCYPSMICEEWYCSKKAATLDATKLSQCHIDCCNECKDRIKDPTDTTDYILKFFAKIRYHLCEKPCCLGKYPWVRKC